MWNRGSGDRDAKIEGGARHVQAIWSFMVTHRKLTAEALCLSYEAIPKAPSTCYEQGTTATVIVSI